MTLLTAFPFSTSNGYSDALNGVLLVGLVCLGVWAFSGRAVAQDELSVSIDRHQARSGESVDIPVRVTGFANVGAISLIITYDPDVLAFAENAKTTSLIAGTPRENFSANVVEPGELRISWFDPTGSTPIDIGEGTLLTITFHNYAGGNSPVAFTENSEISNIKAKPLKARFEDGGVVGHP